MPGDMQLRLPLNINRLMDRNGPPNYLLAIEKLREKLAALHSLNPRNHDYKPTDLEFAIAICYRQLKQHHDEFITLQSLRKNSSLTLTEKMAVIKRLLNYYQHHDKENLDRLACLKNVPEKSQNDFEVLFAWVKYHLDHAYKDTQHYARALERIEKIKALNIHIEDMDTLAKLDHYHFVCLDKLNKNPNAHQHLIEQMKRLPFLNDMAFALSLTHRAAGLDPSIIKVDKHPFLNKNVSELIKLFKNSTAYVLNLNKLAFCFEKLNQHNKAGQLFEYCVNHYPSDAQSYINYAYFLQNKHEDHAACIALLERLFMKHHKNDLQLSHDQLINACHSISISFIESFQANKAIPYLQRAMNLDPNNSVSFSIQAKIPGINLNKKFELYEIAHQHDHDRINRHHEKEVEKNIRISPRDAVDAPACSTVLVQSRMSKTNPIPTMKIDEKHQIFENKNPPTKRKSSGNQSVHNTKSIGFKIEEPNFSYAIDKEPHAVEVVTESLPAAQTTDESRITIEDNPATEQIAIWNKNNNLQNDSSKTAMPQPYPEKTTAISAEKCHFSAKQCLTLFSTAIVFTTTVAAVTYSMINNP